MPDQSFVGQVLAGIQAQQQTQQQRQPVAYSRITRTPIYTQDVPMGKANFDPATNSINMPDSSLNGPNSNQFVQHESVHALLEPFLSKLLPAMDPNILNKVQGGLNVAHPGLYPNLNPENRLTEGAAYGIQDAGFPGINTGLSDRENSNFLGTILNNLPKEAGDKLKRLMPDLPNQDKFSQ